LLGLHEFPHPFISEVVRRPKRDDLKDAASPPEDSKRGMGRRGFVKLVGGTGLGINWSESGRRGSSVGLFAI